MSTFRDSWRNNDSEDEQSLPIHHTTGNFWNANQRGENGQQQQEDIEEESNRMEQEDAQSNDPLLTDNPWKSSHSARVSTTSRTEEEHAESSPLLAHTDSVYYDSDDPGYGIYSYADVRGRPLTHHDTDDTPRSWWAQWGHRVAYYIPVLAWLPVYFKENHSYLLGDIMASLTVACLLVPQGLSYAGLAQLEPMHGIWTSVAPTLAYSLLGTSRQLSVGPEALVAMLVGTAIIQEEESFNGVQLEPSLSSAELTAIIAVLVGLFNLILGLFRLGFLDSVLSRTMLRGFIAAVGVVICILQCVPLMGLSAMMRDELEPDASAMETLWWLMMHIKHAHIPTALMGFGCIGALLTARLIKRRLARCRPHLVWPQLVPEILLVMVAAILVTRGLRLDQRGVGVLGDIDGAGAFPSLRWPPLHRLTWAQFRSLVTSAALMTMVGFVESVAVTKQHAAKHHYTVSSNRELVALGVANILGGPFGAFPAFGSMARTKINDKAGARTQLAGMLAAVWVLGTGMFLLPFLWYLPRPALAGVVFTAALSLISEGPRELRFIVRLHAWWDLAIMLFVFLVTIAVSVEAGVLMAICISVMLVIRHTTVPRVAAMGRLKGTSDHYRPLHELDPQHAELMDGVLVVRFEEDLYFANCGQLKDRLLRLEQHGDSRAHPADLAILPPADHIVFDFTHVPSVDTVAANILVEIISAYKRRGIAVYVTHLRRDGPLRKVFKRAGLIKLIGEERFYSNVTDVMAKLEGQRRR
ncbi:sulfate transporter family-domain-containing protein [Syncephalis plumigaleata]|nr:sulfate transporter family-domain-containing protein [Syncephalis plumigaleata]